MAHIGNRVKLVLSIAENRLKTGDRKVKHIVKLDGATIAEFNDLPLLVKLIIDSDVFDNPAITIAHGKKEWFNNRDDSGDTVSKDSLRNAATASLANYYYLPVTCWHYELTRIDLMVAYAYSVCGDHESASAIRENVARLAIDWIRSH